MITTLFPIDCNDRTLCALYFIVHCSVPSELFDLCDALSCKHILGVFNNMWRVSKMSLSRYNKVISLSLLW